MRIATLLDDMFEDSEYQKPAEAFRQAGHEVVVIGTQKGKEVHGYRGQAKALTDLSLDEARSQDYDALFIPGGYSPDHLRADPRAVDFTRTFVQSEKPVFAIGRRTESDLRVVSSDVSRDHAEIVRHGDGYLVRDRRSRYGTFVNGDGVTERALAHGDRIRLGRSGGAELVFLVEEAGSSVSSPSRGPVSAVETLRQMAALLEGLRALGSGHVLDEVLALVLDAAIEVTGAERAFIMLADTDGALHFTLARARGQVTLPGKTFDTSSTEEGPWGAIRARSSRTTTSVPGGATDSRTWWTRSRFAAFGTHNQRSSPIR